MTTGAESTPAPVGAAERAVAAALETAAGVTAAEAPKPERAPFREVWWRYLVGLIAMAFALFPVVYVVSAAFNPVPSLSTASVIPEGLTLDNFRAILSDPRDVSHVRIHKGYTSTHAHILVRKADGARHIHYLPATCPELSPVDVDMSLLQQAALLHVKGRHEAVARQAVKVALGTQRAQAA